MTSKANVSKGEKTNRRNLRAAAEPETMLPSSLRPTFRRMVDETLMELSLKGRTARDLVENLTVYVLLERLAQSARAKGEESARNLRDVAHARQQAQDGLLRWAAHFGAKPRTEKFDEAITASMEAVRKGQVKRTNDRIAAWLALGDDLEPSRTLDVGLTLAAAHIRHLADETGRTEAELRAEFAEKFRDQGLRIPSGDDSSWDFWRKGGTLRRLSLPEAFREAMGVDKTSE